MLIAEMEQEMNDRGYQWHHNAIDAEVAENEDYLCPNCGGTFSYRGFKRGDSYRAFIVCTRCDCAEEF